MDGKKAYSAFTSISGDEFDVADDGIDMSGDTPLSTNRKISYLVTGKMGE